ncbi:hypothetical protein [Embleya sp. MST-111070]|uniref:hypothetical protein n=1 Tax=Embleya sp. MST-111070 TaxID=3398231 RepID=UPI003F731695
MGTRSAHACDGPTDDADELLLGWVAACGGAEDGVLGCAVHLGEVLVVWDPGQWHGISSHGSPDDTAAVASAAERIAAEVAEGRWIVAPGPANDEVLPRPAARDELVRAVRAARGRPEPPERVSLIGWSVERMCLFGQ